MGRFRLLGKAASVLILLFSLFYLLKIMFLQYVGEQATFGLNAIRHFLMNLVPIPQTAGLLGEQYIIVEIIHLPVEPVVIIALALVTMDVIHTHLRVIRRVGVRECRGEEEVEGLIALWRGLIVRLGQCGGAVLSAQVVKVTNVGAMWDRLRFRGAAVIFTPRRENAAIGTVAPRQVIPTKCAETAPKSPGGAKDITMKHITAYLFAPQPLLQM